MILTRKTEIKSVIRWFLSIPAAMFYSMAASAMHTTLGSPSGAPGLLALLAQLFLNASIALWFFADARRRGRPLFHDAGIYFFFAWPLFAPAYLFATRGWRAFAPLGWFLLLYFAAMICGSIPYLLFLIRE